MRVTWGTRSIVSEQVILTLHFLVVYWGYLTFSPALMILALCLNLVIVLSGYHIFMRAGTDPARLVIVLTCGALILMLPFAMYRSPFAIFHGATGVASVLAAFVIVHHLDAAAKALRNTLVIVQLITVAFLQTAPETTIRLDHMIEGSSSNGITSFLIVLQASYLILLYRSKGQFPVPTASVTLYICVLGYGRGSIFAAMLLMLIAVGFYFFTIRKPAYRLLFLLAQGIFLTSVFYNYWGMISLYLNTETKLSTGLVDDARLSMWEGYLSKIDFISFFTGASFKHTVIETTYNGNPHSSFIRMHHFFGMPYVAAIVITTGLVMLFSQKGAPRIINALAILTILFRAVSEPILFPTPLDLMFFLCVFSTLSLPTAAANPVYKASFDGAAPRHT